MRKNADREAANLGVGGIIINSWLDKCWASSFVENLSCLRSQEQDHDSQQYFRTDAKPGKSTRHPSLLPNVDRSSQDSYLLRTTRYCFSEPFLGTYFEVIRLCTRVDEIV